MSDYTQGLDHAARPEDDIVTAGQPTREQLAAAAAAGVRTVINLRPVNEFDEYDEQAAVTEAGMRYVLIPVAGPEDINQGNAWQLDDALAEEGRPAMVHCKSSNRVGALMAFRARHIQGKDSQTAMEIGLAAGLNPDSPLLEATRERIA